MYAALDNFREGGGAMIFDFIYLKKKAFLSNFNEGGGFPPPSRFSYDVLLISLQTDIKL